MVMDDPNSLLQPFLPITTARAATTSRPSSAATTATLSSHHHNDRSVIIRLLLVMSVAAISLWANYEASKTFDITLINDAKDSPSGRRFDLFYVSNDRAARVLLNASSFVQNLLYDPDHKKKHIRHVTLRLAGRNLNAAASVAGKHDSGAGDGYYVIDLSPSLLEEANCGEAIEAAVLRAMVRVWLIRNDVDNRAPARVIDGVVEYVAAMAGFGGGRVSGAGEEESPSPVREDEEDGDWWEDKGASDVARFLRCCEGYKEGFIRRLSEAMRDTWHDRIVDEALGMPAKKPCGFYNASWATQ